MESQLFCGILALGFDLLTYRKGKIRPLARRLFHEETTWADGKKHTHLIAEAETRLSDGALLRCIALEEFAIGGLAEYAGEPADPERTVLNPRKASHAKRTAKAREEVAKWEHEVAARLDAHQEGTCRTKRGFNIAHAKARRELLWACQRLTLLQQEGRAIPARVPVKDLAPEGAEVVKLAVDRQLLVDAVKMAAYRAETKLVQLVAPHFARTEEEGRRLHEEALALSADLVVDGTQATVRLQPMSAPRFTSALVALCATLIELDPGFPESPYRLRYEVEGAE